MLQLPPPAATTDVYLAAVIERLDVLIALMPKPPAAPESIPRTGTPSPTAPAPRKRATPRKSSEGVTPNAIPG